MGHSYNGDPQMKQEMTIQDMTGSLKALGCRLSSGSVSVIPLTDTQAASLESAAKKQNETRLYLIRYIYTPAVVCHCLLHAAPSGSLPDGKQCVRFGGEIEVRRGHDVGLYAALRQLVPVNHVQVQLFSGSVLLDSNCYYLHKDF